MKTIEPIPTLALDDLLHMAASAIEDLLEHTDPNTSYYSGVWSDVPGKLRAAAMLQAGNSPVIPDGKSVTASTGIQMIPDGYVMVPKEPTESMINTWLSEVANWRGHVAGYKAMPAAAPQPQNAPQNIPEIIPGWIQVSERMPEDRISVILWDAEIGEVTSGHYSHKTQTFYHCGDAIENEITHWMPPPCAPQEVKGEHQIRDEMDMGARITSHRFKV